MPYYYFSTYWHEAAQARSKHARKCGVLVQPFIDFSSYRYRNGHGRRKSQSKALSSSFLAHAILRSAQEAEVEQEAGKV